jgi:hypothetical protein
MDNKTQHIISLDPSVDAGVMSMLEGMGQFASGIKQMYGRCVEEKEQLREIANAARIQPLNIVAEGCQSDVIVILNAMYELGVIAGSKKEFMQRMADALGCPGIADYSKQLYKAKWTNKYSDIFRKLAEVAEQEKTKDN